MVVIITIFVIFTVVYIAAYFSNSNDVSQHHDSRPGSYYQQSQKKQWQTRDMDR